MHSREEVPIRYSDDWRYYTDVSAYHVSGPHRDCRQITTFRGRFEYDASALLVL